MLLKLAWVFTTTVILQATIASADLSFCSTQNTGSDSSYSLYQSNGLCRDTCTNEGAYFAVLSGNDCYCSNIAPGEQTSLSDCSNSCPGYPVEQCAGNGYYGYIQVRSGASTLASSSSTTASSETETDGTTSSDPTSSSGTTSSSVSTSSSNPPSSTTSSTSSTTSRSSTTSSSSSSSSSTTSSSSVSPSTSSESGTSSSRASTTSAPSISTVYSVTTVSGTDRTLIVSTQYISTFPSTPTDTSTDTAADGSSRSANSNSFWDSTGKVAGTFVAVAVVVILLLLLLGLLLYRRFSKRNGDEADSASGSNISSLMYLKNGILEKNNNFHTHTASNGDTLVPINIAESDNIVDQRLDPGQMFMNLNNSRGSFSDHRDYTRRVLRVANPENDADPSDLETPGTNA